MDCREVKNLITLYVDGELDSVESREIVEHLSRCESCYLEVRRERYIKKLLKEGVVFKEPPVSLISNITKLYEERRDILPLVLRFVPVMLLIFFLSFMLFYKLQQDRLDNKILRNISNPPMSASISDINKLFSIFKPAKNRLTLKENSSSNIRFIGLKYNRLDDREAAHIYYNHKGKNISVFAISGTIIDKAHFIPIIPYRDNSYIVKRDGKKLLFSTDRDITYAVAGDADEDELYEVLSSLR